MEAANLTSRPNGNNNGYQLLPLLNSRADRSFPVDYQDRQSSYMADRRHSECAELFSDSSDDDDSVSTNGSDNICCDEGDERLEEWQKKVDSKGEIFYLETYSEDATSQSLCNTSTTSSSSENRANKGNLNIQESKSGEMGILSSLKWRPKQQSSKKGKNNDQHAAAGGKADGKSSDVVKNENFTKILKEVTIALPVKRPNLGRGVPPIEGILGLVLKRISKKGLMPADTSDAVMITNIIPDSPASSIPDIRIGDRIVSVNDVEINSSNLEQVSYVAMAAGCQQVKLGLCRIVLITPKEDKASRCSTRSSATFLPKLLSNQDEYWSEMTSSLTSLPHLVLYLNLANCDATERKEDIIYQFPRGQNKLVEIRGAFVTLVQLIPDVVGSRILTSSLWTGSCLMHVAFAQDNRDRVMLLALPADCVSLSEIRHVADNIISTVHFQYGTLDQAFGNAEQQSRLDLLFALVFASYVADGSPLELCQIKKARTGHRSRLPQQLPLSTDLQICADSVINEFESSDFADMSEDHYDIRRLYSILGVSLYYKGFLVTNHLSKTHSQDVFLYLLHSGMLDTSRQHLTNIIVWKEVFPSERLSGGPTDRRWFLLVVGKHHFLLAVILETGGCASRAIGPQAPDPFYVERAQATLLQLQLHQITTSLNSAIDNPLISCMAQLKKGHNFSQCCSDKKSDNAGNKMNRPTELHNFEIPADTDSDSTSVLSTAASGTSDDTAPILGRRVLSQNDNDMELMDDNQNRGAHLHRQRQLPSFLDLSNIMDTIPVSTNERNTPPARLLSGPQNVLFSYLQISHGHGVVVCPVLKENGASEHFWPLKEIIQNFERGCDVISRALNNEEEPVVEQGMMFRCSKSTGTENQKSTDSISYWIVGRLFKDSSPREVYVCYQDTCPQTLVEIAFRLSFGMVV